MAKGARVAIAAILSLAAVFGLADWLTRPPLLPAFAQTRAAWQPSEAWLYDRNGRLLDSSRVNFAVRRLAWTPLERIAPVVRETILHAEDRRFAEHGGIDWLALGGAMRDRIEGKRGRGASTITMQLAGFLSPEMAAPGARGWRDKLRQMRTASALDDRWSKDQQFEAYLNLAGFRGEAQGIGAAALGLFGKTPESLSRDDGLLLAALLPNPQASPDAVARRACGIAGGDCARFPALAATMLGPTRSLALDPGLAPHLSDRLLTKPGLRVRTTLDMDVQRMAVTALRRQLLGLGATRARDGAVIVVDNASGDVLAYVGGIGGNSTSASVDAAAAYRQAGSTLKPFLYAQAIERRYLTAASILDDSPVQLDTASGLYVPQNYDRAFKGPVSARTALAASLNVPAVRTLILVGTDAFRDRLWDMGYRGLVEDGGYYGFSLALGSAEVTLGEQANAYRALANGGRSSPIRLLLDQPVVAPRAVTSASAAWIVSDMLADPNARAGTFGMDSALRLPFWAAVKTGTSKAMRDNWCVGYSRRFTVAVWVGNVEGDSMRAVSGTSGAAPVWRDVMLALERRGALPAPTRPDDVEERRVTFATTHELPRPDYFLAGTGMTQMVATPAGARRPRIASPVSGSVYALDPDIPPDRQRLAIDVTGAAMAHRLRLDAKDFGSAEAPPLLRAGPGKHELALVDVSGKTVDRVTFTIR